MHELAHLTDDALASATLQLVARDRRTTACLLAHLAEFDDRKLHLALGYPSLFAYCVEALHYSESAAYRRIHAARASRRFPRLLALVAEGRLHLAAICLLAPHFTEDNFDELVAAATPRSKAQVERWLAVRFAPPLLVAAIGAAELEPILAAQVDAVAVSQLVPGRVGADEMSVAVATHTPPPALVPQVVLRVALPEATQAKLQHARALLGHAVPSGDTAQILDRVLDVFIAHAERRKFAATKQPRKPRTGKLAQGAKAARRIPAQVKRAVRERDHGRCAYVSARGRRCAASVRLEFDHVVPVARGGVASTDNVRLLCRAHNRFEAGRVLGRELMGRRLAEARAERATRTTRPRTSCDDTARPGSPRVEDRTGPGT